ncbi:MAG: 5,10-methylenetetrahydrofolate reductase [Thermoprotei archaeon]
MEYLLELVPRNRDMVDEIVSRGKDFFKYYTIPEGPGGYPGIFSVATAMYIKLRYGYRVLPHIRLYDINRLALLSIANAVKEYRLDGLVLLRGDKPWKGSIVNDISSEEALQLLRKKGYGFPIGMILSLNYSLDDIVKRLELRADFYHVINYGTGREELLSRVYREAKKWGVKLYTFILLGLRENEELFKKLGQPYIKPEELRDQLVLLSSISDGVVLSSPLNPLEGIDLLIKYAV